jgi:hypothetical protein
MRPRSLHRRLPLAALLCVVTLALIEATLRLTMTDFFAGRFDYGYEAQAGFERTAEGWRIKRTGGRRFWPQFVADRKAPETLRIVAIGDSISRGHDLEHSYPWLAAEGLKATGRPAEAVNLSVAGYGAVRKQLVAGQVPGLAPDLVILQIGMSNEFEDERDRARADEFDGWHPRHWAMKSWLLRRLYEWRQDVVFTRLLPESIRSATLRFDAEEEVSANRDPVRRQVWRERFETVTRETIDGFVRQDTPVLLVPRLRVEQGPQGPRFEADGVLDWCRAQASAKVRCVSVAELMGEHPEPAAFSADGVHMLPELHARLGTLIAQHIAAWPQAQPKRSGTP